MINETGYLPIDPEDAKLFFQLADMRYEKRSTRSLQQMLTLGPGDEVFQDTKLANTILDRILHHATVVMIISDSYRLKAHLTKEDQ